VELYIHFSIRLHGLVLIKPRDIYMFFSCLDGLGSLTCHRFELILKLWSLQIFHIIPWARDQPFARPLPSIGVRRILSVIVVTQEMGKADEATRVQIVRRTAIKSVALLAAVAIGTQK
jgi:hypothetical protein